MREEAMHVSNNTAFQQRAVPLPIKKVMMTPYGQKALQ